jgi:ribosome-associated protein
MDTDALTGDGFVIPASAVQVTAVRASGPGGQRVNKVSTKVDLRLDPAAIVGLDEAKLARLSARIAARHWDADGRLMVTSQRFRDQPQNLRDAREKLLELITRALETPRARRPTRPTRGSVQRRLTEKRHRADRKRSRSTADGD